jgi:hypothetical protein
MPYRPTIGSRLRRVTPKPNSAGEIEMSYRRASRGSIIVNIVHGGCAAGR